MPGLKKVLLVLTVVTVLFSACGCSQTVTSEQFLQSYQLRSGTTVEVYNRDGNITITGWDQDTVEIAALKESYGGQEALDQVDIFIDITEKIVIQTIHADDDADVTVSYEIRVPEDIVVGIIECSNGNISLDGLLGNPVISTSNGTVTVKNVNGIVSARSSNGNITVSAVKSLGDLTTSNGTIEAELPVLNDNLEIRTSNGSITLALTAALRADLEASTSNGTISINNLNIDTAKFEKTSLTGSMNGGGYKINISTSNGSINLLPLR